MTEIAGHPYWQATFDKNGLLHGQDRLELVASIKAAGIKHLFAFAHGWNNNRQSADNLFEDMFGQMAQAAGKEALPGPIGFLGVFWPSIWFPEPPAGQSAAVSAATQAGAPGQADAAVTGAQIVASLTPAFDDPVQRDALSAMGELVDAGLAGVAAGNVSNAVQRLNLDAFHQHLATIVPAPTDAWLDSGETPVITTDDPATAYEQLAIEMGSAQSTGDAQGLGDVFGAIWNGAKDALRIASYLEMKSPAGTVGTNGLGPLLEALHTVAPEIDAHLMGHSFGARLVSFSLTGISSAEASPVKSLTLVQGAFSHWAFADASMPFGQQGSLYSARDRVRGPVLSTFSKHDWAVGIWYPKASFLAGDEVSAVGAASKWGGMGSDGAQWVPGPDAPEVLAESGHPYDLQSGKYYRFDCNAVIADTSDSAFSGAHSDIRHPQISWLPVCAARDAVGAAGPCQ